MSEFSWLGVIISTFVTSLSLGGYFVMMVPYFDDAPYLHELRKNTRLATLLGLVLVTFFFCVFYLGAIYLDQNTSGPLLIFAALIIALPVSMLLGTETWEHYHPKGINRVSGQTAVIVATGIGLAELAGGAVIFILLMQLG